MVEITALGHASFKLAGKEISVVTDPFLEEAVGLKYPRVEADVVTISHNHSDHNNQSGVRGDFICFDAPGEYEIRGSGIVGIDSYHDDKKGEERGKNTIFIYEIGGVKLCHLGNLGHLLSSEQVEKIDGVDVLFIPVDGKVSLDSKKAIKIISEISPKIVIPMHYKNPNHPEFDDVDTFLSEMGKEPKRATELKVRSKDLGDDLEIYVLSPKNK